MKDKTIEKRRRFKKEKLIALILMVVAFCGASVGCQEGKRYTRERFYGVVRFSEEMDRLVVYIPNMGDVEIPESEGCCSCFDGHEENDDYSYQLKAGDLVSINFRYKKSWDDHGVQIMGIDPAMFDRKAHLIEALRENISFAKVDGGYELSFPSTEEIDSAEIGDTLYFIQHGGHDGRAYMKLYASGEIIARSDGMITVMLTIPEGASEFLNHFCDMTVELTWGE